MSIIRSFFILFLCCQFTTLCHAEIIRERGSLLEFFAGSEDGCEYDNWMSHISEGIAIDGYNDYGPAENDRQTEGFGAYQIIDSLDNPEQILLDWYGIFTNVLSNQIDEADEILSNSAFADYYRIVLLEDGDRNYVILREVLNMEFVDDNGTEIEDDDVTGSFDYGWGLYVFNLDPTTENVVFEIPHPCDDFITPFIAIDAFLNLNALAIFVSGAGREVEWTEEGEYNNALTRSDPTRQQNVSTFQEAHKSIVDSVGSEFIIQIHSYDTGGRVLPQTILSAVLHREPNPPLLDVVDKFDIVSLTPPIPVAANTIGNVDHEAVGIYDYYSVFYDGGYFYNGITQISNVFGGLQGWDSPQVRYSHAGRNLRVEGENFLHVEHDEFPDVILEEILEFFPADGVPTYQTYAYIVDFYRPLYTAIDDYYHKTRFHNVPAEFETIQTAINASFGGDTILVQPGTYTENIDFLGKNILLTSKLLTTGNRYFTNHTILDGNQNGSVVTFSNGEGPKATLKGFTVTNGSFENGGGIRCVTASPTIDHCLIIGNSAEGVGGAIFCEGAAPLIINCTIAGNSAEEGGGALFGWDGTSAILKNCILWGNNPEELSFLRFGDPNTITFSYTDIDGGVGGIVARGNAVILNGVGNIVQNPLFADPQESNYLLTIDSPCIDAGDPDSPVDSDGSNSDMGAFPVQSQRIRLSHNVLEFDEVYLSRVDSLSFTISNIGQSPLVIHSLTINPDNSPFSIGAGGGEEFEIDADSERVIWIRFTSDQADNYMAILEVVSDDLHGDSLYVRLTATAVSVDPSDQPITNDFGLNGLYPNPFNSSAVVSYTLTTAGTFSLIAYDISGRVQAILRDGLSVAGMHTLEINAAELAAGVYFLKLETDQNIAIQKFVVVK